MPKDLFPVSRAAMIMVANGTGLDPATLSLGGSAEHRRFWQDLRADRLQADYASLFH